MGCNCCSSKKKISVPSPNKILYNPLEIQKSTLNNSGLINSEYQGIPTAKSPLIDKSDLVSGIILTLALVIHSTFEGIAIGLLTNNSDVITFCVVVMIHNIPTRQNVFIIVCEYCTGHSFCMSFQHSFLSSV